MQTGKVDIELANHMIVYVECQKNQPKLQGLISSSSKIAVYRDKRLLHKCQSLYDTSTMNKWN